MYKNDIILFTIFNDLRNLKQFSIVPEEVIYNSFFHLLFIKALYKIPSLQSLTVIHDDEWDLLNMNSDSKKYFISVLFPELIESNDRNIKFYFENSYKDFEYLDDYTLLNLYKIVNLITLEELSPVERYKTIEDLLDRFSKLLGKSNSSISFRTPKKLRDFITLILDPKAKIDRIADLTCGTGSLLLSACVHAYNDFSNIEKNLINGVEINRGMINIFIMHSYISGIYNINIEQKDILKEFDPRSASYNKIYSDAPFGMKVYSQISPNLTINTRNADVLFLEATMAALAEDGLAAVIVSKSLLFSSSLGHLEIRKYLVEDMHIEAIISLPLRYNYSSIPLVLVVFKNIQSDKPILFMDLDKDIDIRKDINLVEKRLNLAIKLYHIYCHSGYDKNIALDELSDLCWFVSKKKIIDNNYVLDLSFHQPEIKIKSLPIKNIIESMEDHFSLMLKEIKKIQALSMRIEKVDKNNFHDYNLGDVCEMYSGRPLPKEEMLDDGELPFVQIRDITKSDKFEITSSEKSVSNNFASNYKLVVVEAGTLLVSIRGTLGITAIAGTRMCIGPNIVALNVIDKQIDSWFLLGWFQKRKLTFQANTTGIIPMLTISMLKNLTISIPLKQKQSIYADYYDSLKTLQKLKQLSNENNTKMDQIADSLFDNYFTPKA